MIRYLFFTSLFLATTTCPAIQAMAQAPTDQDGIVGALSGHTEIQSNVFLKDRYGEPSRAMVRSYLSRLFAEVGVVARVHDYGNSGKNIFGVLDGTTESRSTVVIGAHFDSVKGSPGANDNATGVALVHETVRRLAQLGCRSRDLMVVYFDEEERMLYGSSRFAGWLKSGGVSVHSVHTADQLGWDKDGDRAMEIELPTTGLRQLYQRVADHEGMSIHFTSTGATDHSSFRKLGFPAVGITEEYVNGDTTPFYHRPNDTYATVDFGYLESATDFFTSVIRELLTDGCPSS